MEATASSQGITSDKDQLLKSWAVTSRVCSNILPTTELVDKHNAVTGWMPTRDCLQRFHDGVGQPSATYTHSAVITKEHRGPPKGFCGT